MFFPLDKARRNDTPNTLSPHPLIRMKGSTHDHHFPAVVEKRGQSAMASSETKCTDRKTRRANVHCPRHSRLPACAGAGLPGRLPLRGFRFHASMRSSENGIQAPRPSIRRSSMLASRSLSLVSLFSANSTKHPKAFFAATRTPT